MLFFDTLSGILLSFALLFCSVLAQIRPEQLGVSYNKEFLSKTGEIAFGSIAEIEGLDEWSDKQVAELAFQASEAAAIAFRTSIDTIADDYKKRHRLPKRKPDIQLWPGVTTTLVVDNTAYISTSIKGAGTYLYDPARPDVPKGQPRYVTLRYHGRNKCRAEVVDALKRCQLRSPGKFKEMKDEEKRMAKNAAKGKPADDDTDAEGIKSSGLRTGASCGEPMAALAYCTTGSRKPLAEANARVMAVRRAVTGAGSYANPCEGWASDKTKEYPGEWGCKVLMNSEEGLNVKVIAKEDAASCEKIMGNVATNALQIRYP